MANCCEYHWCPCGWWCLEWLSISSDSVWILLTYVWLFCSRCNGMYAMLLETCFWIRQFNYLVWPGRSNNPHICTHRSTELSRHTLNTQPCRKLLTTGGFSLCESYSVSMKVVHRHTNKQKFHDIRHVFQYVQFQGQVACTYFQPAGVLWQGSFSF